MGIRLVVFMQALPGKREVFIEESRQNAARVQNEKGCIEFKYLQDIEDPDNFILLENWADQESLELHWEGLRSRPPRSEEIRIMHGMERYEYTEGN